MQSYKSKKILTSSLGSKVGLFKLKDLSLEKSPKENRGKKTHTYLGLSNKNPTPHPLSRTSRSYIRPPLVCIQEF